MGGEIAVSSELGSGSTFAFTLQFEGVARSTEVRNAA
jgi:signal transduction histidine kinase